MSITGSPATENKALLEKTDQVEREVVALAAAVRRAKTIRLVLLCAALLFVAAALWMFYSLAVGFASEENRALLAEKAREQLSSNSDQYVGEIRVLMENCSPVLSKAFY